MYEIIYLEPDAEITSVINRLKKNEKEAIALVVPRGATLVQSMVNLKLLKRSAEEAGKQVAIVSTDKTSRNLASQVGLAVFSKALDAEKSSPTIDEEIEEEETPVNSTGLKVNNYYSKKREEVAEPEEMLDPEETEEDVEMEEIEEDEEEIDEDEEEKSLKAEVKKEVKKIEEKEEADEEDEEEEIVTRKVSSTQEKPNKEKSLQDKKTSQQEEKPMNRKVKKLNKILAIIAAVFVLAGLGSAYFYLPTATAKVLLKTEDVEFKKEIKADKNAKTVDASKLAIPAQLVEVEKQVSGTYTATGKKDVGEKATGKITISNSYDQSSFVLPKGSHFVSNSKIFLSNADVSVPGAVTALVGGKVTITPGTVDVAVTAENSGDEYNIASSSFTITSLMSDKQKSITGKSAAAMSGGSTKNITFVQGDDLDKAQAALLDEAKKSTPEVTKKAADGNIIIFDEMIKSDITANESTKKENEEAANFDYKLTVKLYTIGYLKTDLSALIQENISKGISQDQMIVDPENTTVVTDLISGDVEDGVLNIRTTAKYKVGKKIADQEIINKIKGKKIGSARMAAEGIGGVYSAVITVNPGLVKTVPFRKEKIKVEFGFASEQ